MSDRFRKVRFIISLEKSDSLRGGNARVAISGRGAGRATCSRALTMLQLNSGIAVNKEVKHRRSE